MIFGYVLAFAIGMAIGSSTADASQCFLMQDLNNPSVFKVEQRENAPKHICKVPCDGSQGDVYKVEILERDESAFQRIGRAIGLNAARDWSPGEVLAENEYIECSIDDAKKAAKEKAQADKIKKEREDKLKKDADWQDACRNETNKVLRLICAREGF